ncbi:MAG: hypothetical protein H7A25_24595 [Leptospiraceae bacterium]|nr:hypothetical protein [Leptospiraceae bacterium]
MSKLNKLKPDPNAEGNHTTFIEDIYGYILKYATYIRNILNPTGYDEVKRVDLFGDEHFNKKINEMIDTPHVHEKGIPGNIRKANEEEIPKRNRRENQ